LKRLLYIIVLCFTCSCNFFQTEEKGEPIARVNNTYLYKEDIKDIVPKDASEQDSASIVNTYINRWASQLLLMDGALVNLPEDKQKEFSKLVKQYKSDLYTKAYLELLVKKNIDTTVTQNQSKTFYESNKESFKLNDDLLQFRYIKLLQNTIDLDTFKNRFKRFKYKDKKYLDSVSVQFKSYTLNDSVWIKLNQVASKIPAITTNNKNELLKKSNFIELKDSINLYLIQVKDVRLRNDYAPLEYVNNSIKKIVINKRKLELIKELENDITKNAITNNDFQIYN